MICESNDPKAIMTSVMGWSDLMKEEIVPLLDPIELFPEKKGKGSKK